MSACKYMEEIGSAAILTAKRSAGVASEVNFGNCVTCMPLPSVNKTVLSGFETWRRYHQKSKTGVSVVPQKKFQGYMGKHYLIITANSVILQRSQTGVKEPP